MQALFSNLLGHMDSNCEEVKRIYGKLFADVSDSLFQADPIGINFDDNTDEYALEAGTIIPRLKNRQFCPRCSGHGQAELAYRGHRTSSASLLLSTLCVFTMRYIFLVAIVSLLLISPLSLASNALLTRNLDCDKERTPRAQTICRALEHEMHWEWFGHAIVSPSFRVNFDSVREVYCRLPIRTNDTTTLVEMALSQQAGNMRNAQIENGASGLLYLLGTAALDNFPAPETIMQFNRHIYDHSIEFLRRQIINNINDSGMIWNRTNPKYLLRNGCRE